MGQKLHLADVPETVIPAGRWQPLNERLGIRTFGVSAVVLDPGEDADIEHDESDDSPPGGLRRGRRARRLPARRETEVEAGPGDVVAVPDPAETRTYWALEPGTRIVCLGAGPGAEHPFGAWIADDAGGG